MATVTPGITFVSGETVTPAKLNSAATPTVSDIVNADIKSDAAIAGTKIAPAFGGQDITVSTANRSITNTGNFALSFGTNNTERVRIDNAGNVGIGATNPAAKFAVSTGDNKKQFTVDVSADPVVKIGLPDWYDTGSLAFVNGSGGERMRIDASGNVGIGTTSPTALLHVSTLQDTYGLFVTDGTRSGGLIPSSVTGGLILYNSVAQPIGIWTNNTERMRIKSTGQIRFQPLSADPTGAEAGDVYYNSSTNKLKVYNGTSWLNLH